MRLLTLFITLLVFSGPIQAQNSISINGTAKVQIPADQISFRINLNTEAATPQEAYELHKKREKVLVQLLKKHDIEEENINFEPISISQTYNDQYTRDEQKRIQTRQMVILFLENFDIYEQIQITLIENNFNEFSGDFMSSQAEQGEEEALKKALKLARKKADIIAGETGLTISGIKDISYSFSQQSPRPMMEMTARKSSDNLLEFDQSVSVSANVSVTYNFEQ